MSRVSRTAAISLSSMSDSQAASSIDSSGPAAARPALCTTPSMRPQRATAASANAARSEATDTSARTAEHPAAGRLQSRLCLPQPLLVAAADRHRRALGDQLRGEREAEPVAATGDEHDLAAELEIHRHSSLIAAAVTPARNPSASAWERSRTKRRWAQRGSRSASE